MVFIGPTDNAMFLLGDKIASTIIAQSAEVPCVSWSGTGVNVEKGADGTINVDDATFAKCCVTSGEEALADSECSICLAEFEPSTQQKPCVLTQQKACGHWHHTACLKQWYGTQLSAGRSRSCPLCKTPVEPPAAAATAPVTATPAAARAIELYNSYPRVVM